MADSEGKPDVDYLVDVLKQRVEQRRNEGLYPDGMEADLDGHFRRIVSHRVMSDLDDVREGMLRMQAAAGFGVSKITQASAVPGGAILHKTLARIQQRQTEGVLAQMRDYAEAVQVVLTGMLTALERPGTHTHADLLGQIDAILERLSAYERGPQDSAAALGDLRDRVQQLEAIEARRTFKPWFRYEDFEAEFRGSREGILENYRDLATEFKGLDPVLDIGCGRGEFLELLRDLDVEASGVDIDAEYVTIARDLGFDAVAGDGIQKLASLPDQGLGGIVLIQVVEHLSPQQLLDLIELAGVKLRPGGKLIMETLNPQSLYVFAHPYFLDPTHDRLIHPAYLSFLTRAAGFSNVDLQWRTMPPEDDILAPAGDDEAERRNVERLNELLFAAQDYAIIATR